MREPLSHPCGPIISSVRLFDTCLWSKFYYQYSTDDIFSQGQGTSFGMNKFSKKKPVNSYKYYVVRETSVLLNVF